ncbi:hypothetical protein [Nonomuraea sp. NPDC048826]|uniref:hypothetical protein n=1 Tax=Nonomuraea sp. NPDC048826 TaxID=3364347 RepID=UPI00371C0A29
MADSVRAFDALGVDNTGRRLRERPSARRTCRRNATRICSVTLASSQRTKYQYTVCKWVIMPSFSRYNLKDMSRKIEHLLVTLCVLITVGGCSTQWFPTLLEVDEATVGEVSKVGKVVTRTTIDFVYENTHQITQMLVVDTGKNVFSDALKSMQEGLEREGWTVIHRRPDSIDMESARWGKVILSVRSLGSLEQYYLEARPELAEARRDHDAGVGFYLLIELIRVT